MSVTLTYPSSGTVSTSVVLRDPEFGDQRSIDINPSIQRISGNEVTTYRDSNWLVKDRHTVVFRGLTSTKKEELKTFLTSTVGKEILFSDQYGTDRRGYLTLEIVEYVTESEDSFQVTLEFLEINPTQEFVDEGICSEDNPSGAQPTPVYPSDPGSGALLLEKSPDTSILTEAGAELETE